MAVSCLEFFDRYLPLFGRFLEQHRAGGGTGHTHCQLSRGFDRGAAACDLQRDGLCRPEKEPIDRVDQPARKINIACREPASESVICVLFVRRCFEYFYRCPVCIEFVCQHHRERRVRTLAHLGVRDDGRDGIIRGNLEPDIEDGVAVIGDESSHFARSIAAAYCDTEYDDTARCDAGGDERAP